MSHVIRVFVSITYFLNVKINSFFVGGTIASTQKEKLHNVNLYGLSQPASVDVLCTHLNVLFCCCCTTDRDYYLKAI